MLNIYDREIESYRMLNKIAKPGSVILLGSSFAKDIPVCELRQTFNLDCNVYNRSLSDLSVFDADQVIDDCVLAARPKKVLLQLGESDLERGYRTIPEIIEAYEKLIKKIRAFDKRCEIVVVSVCESGASVHPQQLNTELSAMARRMRCKYADITSASENESSKVRAFSLLKFFMLDRITDYDVMSLAE